MKAEITLARQSAFVIAIRTNDVVPGSAQHAVKTGVDPQLGVGFELGSHSDVVAYAGMIHFLDFSFDTVQEEPARIRD